MYASLLRISGALYLSVFEQPANRVFFGTLLMDKSGTGNQESVKKGTHQE